MTEHALLPTPNVGNSLYAEVIRLGTILINEVTERDLTLSWARVYKGILFIPAKDGHGEDIWLACAPNIFDRSAGPPSDNPVIGGQTFSDLYLQSVIDRFKSSLDELGVQY